MPISSYVDPAYKIYRRFKDKREDDWDGDIFLNRTQIDGETCHDDEPVTAPPYVVLVQGPPKVGKSMLIKSLVNYFTTIPSPSWDWEVPITVVIDNTRRLQFIECPDDISGMIDAAKYADLVLLLVDASYGFEADTFEFVNLLQAHSFPPVIGVFTHIDEIKINDEKEPDETIHHLMFHFQTEICQGTIVSRLSGPCHNLYKRWEVQLLAEYISNIHFFSSAWRAAHPYVLVEHLEDLTSPDTVQKDPYCKRNISLYGYLRGRSIKNGDKVHIAGVGDFRLAGVRSITDPFPLPSQMEKGKDFLEATHTENEIFRTGTYLRLEVHEVPSQVVENFDPCHPILVGGISPEEETEGYVQARLKRHNWHMKLLKSADPVTVSAGWRRYQTKPIYAGEVDDERYEIVDFNPERMHCLAMFWGPLAPLRTRIAVVHETKEVFRIAAKAVVLDLKSHMRIMKESELKGKPHEILDERTALIKFKSKDIDAAEFEGSPIRTWRGIWGKVIKADKRKGTARIARCTFEKKIYKHDTFILPVYCQIEAPRFFRACDSNKDSLEKKRLEQRRRVEITDEEPFSHPDSSYYTMFRNIKYMTNKGKETVVVMSEEKREELLEEKQREENKKLIETGFGWRDMGIELTS